MGGEEVLGGCVLNGARVAQLCPNTRVARFRKCAANPADFGATRNPFYSGAALPDSWPVKGPKLLE